MATVFLVKSAGRGQGSSVVEAEAEIRGGVVAIVTNADNTESVYTKGQWFETQDKATEAISKQAEADKARKAKALPDRRAKLKADLAEVEAEMKAAGIPIEDGQADTATAAA